jgi:V/A-type H+-transporting ATPase subunit C
LLGILRYGFINTKIRGMKKEFITYEQYLKLTELSYDELIDELKRTPYGHAFRGMYRTPTPIELERILLEELTKSYIKILKWLPTQAMRVIALHMMKYEAENIKALLRLKTLNAETERLKQHITPIPLGLSIEEYVKVYEESKDIEEAIGKLMELGLPIPLNEAIEGGVKDIKIIEARIEKMTYRELMDEAKKLDGKSSKSIRELLGLEIDLTNVKNVLRAKKIGIDWSELGEYIITPTYKVGLKKLKNAFERGDYNEALREALSKDYPNLINVGLEALKKGGLEALEKLFSREIFRNYKRVWVSGFRYDISPVLAYLTRKMIEMKNLKVIAYGKSFELPKERIMEEIIV